MDPPPQVPNPPPNDDPQPPTPTLTLPTHLLGLPSTLRPLTISPNEDLPALRHHLQTIYKLPQPPTFQISWGQQQGTEKREVLTGENWGRVFERLRMERRMRMGVGGGVGVLLVCPGVRKGEGERERGDEEGGGSLGGWFCF
ncbi:hypothetical protein G7Y79_00010g028510 [Physcia stellaris]|nr:hypothetical protein G7Y79_00010g028510 [Physcia stellaris]